jgi:hypothetical protein
MSTGNERSQTIAEFCAHEHISKATFYKLKAAGLGPDEFRLPNSTVVRITAGARETWRQRMAELAQGEAARLEAERRSAQAAAAGRLAAASPRHISKQQQKSRRRQRQAP